MFPPLVILGVLLSFSACVLYIRDMLAGRTKPNRVSWFLWALPPFIGVYAATSDGATWATLPTFMAGLNPLLVLVASFASKKAYWKITVFDMLCGLFSLLALLAWMITENPASAILFAILADALAGVPTLVKAFSHPETETGVSYALFFVAQSTAFFAISTWSFTETAFPLYLITINALLFVTIFRKKLFALVPH